jgi:hypothetical protein
MSLMMRSYKAGLIGGLLGAALAAGLLFWPRASTPSAVWLPYPALRQNVQPVPKWKQVLYRCYDWLKTTAWGPAKPILVSVEVYAADSGLALTNLDLPGALTDTRGVRFWISPAAAFAQTQQALRHHATIKCLAKPRIMTAPGAPASFFAGETRGEGDVGISVDCLARAIRGGMELTADLGITEAEASQTGMPADAPNEAARGIQTHLNLGCRLEIPKDYGVILIHTNASARPGGATIIALTLSRK